MKVWVAIGIAVAMTGCAASHGACPVPTPGLQTMELDAVDVTGDACPAHVDLAWYGDSWAPSYCQETTGDSCGLRTQCPVPDAQGAPSWTWVDLSIAPGDEPGAVAGIAEIEMTAATRGGDGWTYEVVCRGTYAVSGRTLSSYEDLGR